MEWIQPLRVASAMTKSGRMRFAFSALRWKLPKSWPTMGSSQTRCRPGSPIMLLSHVLPLRPEPKIQTMFSGFTPVAGAPSNLLRSPAAHRGTSLYLPASQRLPVRSARRGPSTTPLTRDFNATLPAFVALVAEPDQEPPGLLFVDLPVALVEQVLPVSGHTFAVERRRVLLAPLPSPGELLEARRDYAALHHGFLCIDPEEPEQSLYLPVRTLQQVFVAHLRVAVPEQGRSVFDGPAHPEVPVLGGFPQRLLGEHPLSILGEFLRAPAVGLAPGQFLGREPVRAAPLGAVALLVDEGDRLVSAVSYDVDHPGFGVDLVYLLDEPRAEQGCLVPHDLLAAPGELRGQEIVRGQPDEISYVLVGIPIPAPHGAFDPEPQVLGAEQGVVERAGLLFGLCLGQYFPPVFLAEEPAFTLAEYLGMGVEGLHQPRGAGLREPDDEEHGHLLVGRPGGRLRPQAFPELVEGRPQARRSGTQGPEHAASVPEPHPSCSAR